MTQLSVKEYLEMLTAAVRVVRAPDDYMAASDGQHRVIMQLLTKR
jgi:hypothetical protein